MTIDSIGVTGFDPTAFQTELDAQLQQINNAPENATLTISEKFDMAFNKAWDKLTLEAPGNQNPSNDEMQSTLDKLENAGEMNIQELMMLFHEMTVQNRRAAREARFAARDQQVTALGDAANKIREAAKMALISGIVSGSLSIAGGIAGGVGAFKSGKAMQGSFKGTKTLQAKHDVRAAQTQVDDAAAGFKASQAKLERANAAQPPNPSRVKAAEAEVKASKLELDKAVSNRAKVERNSGLSQDEIMKARTQTKEEINAEFRNNNTTVDADIQKSQMYSNYAQGGTQMATGMGQAGAAGAEYAKGEQEALQKEDETAATKAETLAQEENDFMQTMKDLEREIREKLSAILTSRTDTNKKIMA